jgi:toxin-antitoxin system PIN domain toxin
MSPYLLDVNVLISLVDTMHVHHRRAMHWFTSSGQSNWMTCPTTQNGAIRIISGTKYPQTGITPATVIGVVQNLIQIGNHRFLPDDISLLDNSRFNADGLLRGSQVTDSYLLALAVSAGATLATFDRRMTAAAVRDGQDRVFFIP